MNQFDNGNVNSRDYDAINHDKRIIETLKKQYDLSNPDDIEKCYRAIQNTHFKTNIGREFDDYIFDLKNNRKTSDIYDKGAKSASPVRTVKKQEKKSPIKLESDNRESRDFDLDAQVIKHIKRSNRNRRIFISVLMIAAVCSIAYFVIYYQKAYAAEIQAKEYAKLKNAKFADVLEIKSEPRKVYEQEVVIPEILDEYKPLYNKNRSIIGWIKIDDTKIDYPVMQTVNNQYYLKHNFDQKEDANGCIFLDTNCDVILGCTNYIVYGHHMKSGKMFGSLVKYANKDFYEKHKEINFDTIYEKGTYQVMYVFRSHVFNEEEIAFKYYQFINANSETEFNSAMNEMKSMSLYDTGINAYYGDQLLTLSTCDYQEQNGRFVVVAKRVK